MDLESILEVLLESLQHDNLAKSLQRLKAFAQSMSTTLQGDDDEDADHGEPLVKIHVTPAVLVHNPESVNALCVALADVCRKVDVQMLFVEDTVPPDARCEALGASSAVCVAVVSAWPKM